MSDGEQLHGSGRLGSTLRRDRGEIGGLGPLGVIGLALALVVTVVLDEYRRRLGALRS